MLCVVLFVLAIVAVVVLIAPQAIEIKISDVKVTSLTIPPYCPSPSNQTCCSVLDCSLQMDTSKFRMTLQMDIDVNNKNIINPLTWTTMEALIKYQTATVGSFAESNGEQPRLTQSVRNYTMTWQIGNSGITTLKTLLCNLDAVVSPAPLETPFVGSVSYLNLKYLLYTYSFPELTQTKVINFLSLCASTPDNCKIHPTWRNKICT